MGVIVDISTYSPINCLPHLPHLGQQWGRGGIRQQKMARGVGQMSHAVPGGQRSHTLPRALSSCRIMARNVNVVVQLGELNRLIHLQLPADDTRTERELLLSRIRNEFGGSDDHITLQMQRKNEMFKGLFLDYFDDSIEDGSIFKLHYSMVYAW